MSDSPTAIRVIGLSKAFERYAQPFDLLWEYLTKKARHEKLWALRDISFATRKGEVMGVIGRNGAGKSTLLRLLTGNVDKTEGSIEKNGRIAAILELGAGFHSDYTGRENIMMGGLCLGMSRAEVTSKMDSIIAFSQLEEVIDRPFRTYSTGMKARLAFATATSVDPDILVIDEALSVGDALFAERCHRRIREIVRNGATVLLVTHSLETLYELCTSVIVLHKGRLIAHAAPREAGYAYEQLLAEERSAGKGGYGSTTTVGVPRLGEEHPPTRVEAVYVVDIHGNQVDTLQDNATYSVRVRCFSKVGHGGISLSFRIQKPNGTILYGSSTSLQGMTISIHEGEAIEVDFWWDCHLASGQYFLGGGVAEVFADGEYSVMHILRDACVLTVMNRNAFQGEVDFRSSAKIHRRGTAELYHGCNA